MAEIGRLDLGVLLDLGRPALGDDPTLMEHGDAVGQREYLVDVVIDEHDGDRLAQGPDQVGHPHAIVGGETGERLVEQEQVRARRQGDGDLEQALVAMRQVARHRERLVGETDGGQESHRLRVQIGEGTGVGEHGEAAAVPGLGGDAHVLEHREQLEDADDLERAPHPARHDAVGEQSGDGSAAEGGGATVGADEAGEEVKQGRLAGAVRVVSTNGARRGARPVGVGGGAGELDIYPYSEVLPSEAVGTAHRGQQPGFGVIWNPAGRNSERKGTSCQW